MANKEYAQRINEAGLFTRLYTVIRQFFQPYYRNWKAVQRVGKKPHPHTPSSGKKTKTTSTNTPSTPKPSGKKKTKKKPSRPDDARPLAASISDVAEPVHTPHTPGIRLQRAQKPLDTIINRKTLPGPGVIWTFHNDRKHQVFGHFLPGTGYSHKGRSDTARKKLKPTIYPDPRDFHQPFDRTHLIPVGYHGSEKDNFLLVGWDPEANRNEFREFEEKQKKRQVPIFWFTSIERVPTGARWTYRIYDARTKKKLDELVDTMDCDMVWR